MKDRGLVLIADDDSLLSRTIAAALRRAGYRTITARNGEEAVTLAERRSPHAVILDFMMPVMDGMETARAMKANEKTREIPIVLLSAANNYDLERLSHCGDAWWSARLEKPITMQTLLRTMERVMSVGAVGSEHAAEIDPGETTREYMRQTLDRLDTVRLDLEPGKPVPAASRAYEMGLRHSRRLREGAIDLKSAKLERLAGEAEILLETGMVEGGLGEKALGRLHGIVEKLAAALNGKIRARAVSQTTASDATPTTKVPWVLLVCDDPEYSIAIASRARFYGVCVNNVAQPDLACGIARRYPFAGIAIAGSIASDAADAVDSLRRVCPQVPIVVAGAGRADAHRAALKAGADRILPAGADPERVIAAASELIHQGKPTLGTVLAVAEDPAILGMVEHQLLDLGCNVVSIPSLTALSETVEVIQPDILLADIGESVDEYIEAVMQLRSQARWSALPVVGIARNAVAAQALAGRKDAADSVVVRDRLSEQIRSAVFDIMRSKGTSRTLELDAVTGALSRDAFLSAGATVLEQAQSSGTRAVLAGIDVDTTSLEERIGEGAADLMLKAVYQRVRDSLSDCDPIIGRLDGGYFAILARDADHDAVHKTLAVAASVFTPSVSIRTGASIYTGGHSFKELLADSMSMLDKRAEPASMPMPTTDEAEVDAEHEDRTHDTPPVYIVEDDNVLRTVLTEQLSKAGFDCHGYADGSEALDALLQTGKDGDTPVVLLDLDLPGLDGWSVLEKLRAEKPDVFRTVIMTADEDEETELKGLRAGASDYVVKPVKVPVMVERIRRLIA